MSQVHVTKDEAIEKLKEHGHDDQAQELVDWKNKDGDDRGWDEKAKSMPGAAEIIWGE